MFRCPLCRHPLAIGGQAWSCEEGHSFDVAREGYANLLVTHQRRTREPGDSAAMLRHRRAFLDGGWYAPLAEHLREHHARAGASVLDAGCGEGYYTRGWPGRLWAVDIAKPAVRMAAKRASPSTSAHYAVASVYDLPVVDASIDAVVSVFAPLHSPEFERVLAPGGVVVTVTPGPEHLAGLKAALFATPEAHPDTGPFEREGAATALVPAAPTTRIRYDITLPSEAAIADLVGMTPYAWYVDGATREAVAATGSLSTPVDFLVSAYRLR
jgi:23S rRNA (guanine745-N1)-methyltransferase